MPYIEAISSLSADGRKLYVIVINRHFTSLIKAGISLKGFKPAANAKAWTMTAPTRT